MPAAKVMTSPLAAGSRTVIFGDLAPGPVNAGREESGFSYRWAARTMTIAGSKAS